MIKPRDLIACYQWNEYTRISPTLFQGWYTCPTFYIFFNQFSLMTRFRCAEYMRSKALSSAAARNDQAVFHFRTYKEVNQVCFVGHTDANAQIRRY